VKKKSKQYTPQNPSNLCITGKKQNDELKYSSIKFQLTEMAFCNKFFFISRNQKKSKCKSITKSMSHKSRIQPDVEGQM